MQSFNFFLTDLLDSGRYQAVKMARDAGIDPSEISKIKKGRGVGAKFAERIIAALEPADRADALAAWVRDQVPRKFRKLVEIEARPPARLAERPPSARTLEGALELLHEAAEENRHLHTALLNLAKAWQG